MIVHGRSAILVALNPTPNQTVSGPLMVMVASVSRSTFRSTRVEEEPERRPVEL